MTFKTENIANFEQVFKKNRATIAGFKGCTFLELYQDKQDPSVFFTHSHWEDESHLNAYRDSVFFKSVWSKTKILFSAKPEAWSLQTK